MFFKKKNLEIEGDSTNLINIDLIEVKLHGYEGGGSGIYFKISNINPESLDIIIEKCYVIHNGALIDGAVQNDVGYIGTNSAEKLESGCAV